MKILSETLSNVNKNICDTNWKQEDIYKTVKKRSVTKNQKIRKNPKNKLRKPR